MTVISVELNTTQLSKFKSVDTVSEICMRISSNILDYIHKYVVHGDTIKANRIKTINTMIVWYLGILCRACADDVNYKGLPEVSMIYLERCEKNKEHPVRHAFNLGSLETIPVHLLIDFIHRSVRTTVQCIQPQIIQMTQQKAENWGERIFELLDELSVLLDIKTRYTDCTLGFVLLRIHIPDGRRIIHDFV